MYYFNTKNDLGCVHIVLPTKVRIFVLLFGFKVIVLRVFLFFIGFNLTVLIRRSLLS